MFFIFGEQSTVLFLQECFMFFDFMLLFIYTVSRSEIRKLAIGHNNVSIKIK